MSRLLLPGLLLLAIPLAVTAKGMGTEGCRT
jgi:hypothetical protein